MPTATPQAAWRNRIVEHSDESPGQLAAHPLNYRVHNLAQKRATLDSLNEVGQVKSVVVNKQTGRILDGHLRCALALATGQPTVSVEWVDVPADQEPAIIALLNFTETMASIDDDKLEELMQEVHVENPQLQEVLETQAKKLLPRNRNQDGGEGEEEGEYTISAELFERQDYLVFYFDNEFDWQVACERFGVTTVIAPAADARSTLVRKGVGRVLPASRLLEKSHD